jgi:hypothetical protein
MGEQLKTPLEFKLCRERDEARAYHTAAANENMQLANIIEQEIIYYHNADMSALAERWQALLDGVPGGAMDPPIKPL